MKRFGHLVERIAEYDNLALAFYKAQRGKQNQMEVKAYRNNLNTNLQRLSKQIRSGNVEVGRYSTFTITDPKKRKICAAAFDERVLHHAIMNVCQPIFERNLIFDTYATRVGKGVYAALERARKGMAKYPVVAKLDVRKYFDSIPHEKLQALLGKMFKDPVLLSIFGKIIGSYQVEEGKGVPIGNLTSQFFANFYLSHLDHFSKENLQVPVYIRYMDDILVFGEDKDTVVSFVNKIIHCASDSLLLQFKSPVIVETSQGVSFLGYRLRRNHIGLNGRSKKRFGKKMKVYQKLLDEGVWNEKTYFEHITPLLSFTRWSYSRSYRKKIVEQTIMGQKL